MSTSHDPSTSSLKHQLFETYAANFYAIRDLVNVIPEPPREDIFVCPMCFRYFTMADLNLEDGPIRIEHVPPESLGGPPRTLTCFDCNSWAGRELESSLAHMFDLIEFHKFIPGSSVDARVEFKDIATVNATLAFGPDRQLAIETSEERSNPEEISKLRATRGTLPHPIEFRFAGKRGRLVKARRPECAILRIAYLMAFAQFGYAFILPSPMSIVRAQIREPDSTILPAWGISQVDHLPDDLLGINLVTKPASIRSYGIIFDLATKLSVYRYLVLLPGPADDCDRIYEALSTEEFSEKVSSLEFKHLPDLPGILTNPDLAIASHWIWGNL